MTSAPHTLLRELVDDAGLFPPTELAMPQALERHRADQANGHSMLTHRFLCPLSRWDDLRANLLELDRIDVGLIIDTETGAAGEVSVSDSRVRITHYETRATSTDVARAARFVRASGGGRGERGGKESGPPRMPVFFEVERGPGWLDAVASLHGTPAMGAKVRCGGVRAGLFPSAAELAGFITACVAHDVVFKATAGLHRAVGHTDPATGFRHFGYLNLLVGTAVAADGGGPADVEAALSAVDRSDVANEVHSIPAETAARARRLFASYGSCSTEEPVADAVDMGVIAATT